MIIKLTRFAYKSIDLDIYRISNKYIDKIKFINMIIDNYKLKILRKKSNMVILG